MEPRSLNIHRGFLLRVLKDQEYYSVARLRKIAIDSNYPAVNQLTESLIWHYRIRDFLDHVDAFETISGKDYPAWKGTRWNALLVKEKEDKNPSSTKNLFRLAA